MRRSIQNVQLSADVVGRIEELVRETHPRLRCHGCHRVVLCDDERLLCRRCDHIRWRVTDTELLVADGRIRARQDATPTGQVLRLAARCGSTTLDATPDCIIYGNMVFDNRVSTMMQTTPFHCIDGRHMCRSCWLQMRRMRSTFTAWRHNASFAHNDPASA